MPRPKRCPAYSYGVVSLRAMTVRDVERYAARIRRERENSNGTHE